MIYLDNAATTCMYEGGADIYKEYACSCFFNPSAKYKKALEISKEIDEVRQNILKKLNAKCGQIIFTSGATESNNLSVMGSRRNGNWEYIFSMGEHPSVYNVAKELERQGFVVHYVGLQQNGEIDYEKLESLLNEKTRFVSIIHVSNETGVINDIKRIDNLRNKFAKNALLHVDGVQAFCKINVDLSELGVDFYTVSAHKFHGPKGVGCLYVKKPTLLKPIVFGGGQEGGYRSGTENVAGIMAMNYAINEIDIDKNYQHVSRLKSLMIEKFFRVDGVHCACGQNESPYILNVAFSGVNGETLMRELQDKGVIVGMGSACSAKKAGNRVLESMGKLKDEIKSHIRISFTESLTQNEIELARDIIIETYKNLWERVK